MSNNRSNAFRRLLAAAAPLALVGLSACADLRGVAQQSTLLDPASLSFAAEARDGSAFNDAQRPALEAEWWRAYGDPKLDALIAQALSSNPNLGLVRARLARAQSAIELAETAGKPQLSAGLDITHQRYTANGAVPPALGGQVRDLATLQLSVSWELDFFGRNRAALDAALGSTNAAEADAQAARVLLASNVARTWFQLARIEAQIAVAQRTLAQRQESLGLVRDRVNAGLDTRLELRQSEGGLPEARQQIEALQEQAALARNALRALLGGGPLPAAAGDLQPPPLAALQAPAIGPVIPADLVGRRADVVAARWRVEAAARDVANAKAQSYPNINLVAFAGLSSIGLGRLLNAGSEQWGVGPAVRLPIFDAGRLRANLRGKSADLDAAVESYNLAVVDALRDVADQLASARSIALQQREQQQAQAAAESAYEISLQRYRAGLGNYLVVLTAESTVLAQRRLAVDLAARALDTQVALVRALGGGYAPQGGSALPPPLASAAHANKP